MTKVSYSTWQSVNHMYIRHCPSPNGDYDQQKYKKHQSASILAGFDKQMGHIAVSSLNYNFDFFLCSCRVHTSISIPGVAKT